MQNLRMPSLVDMTEHLSPIIIARPSYARLERLVVSALKNAIELAGFFDTRDPSGRVRGDNKIPHDVACLNEWVTYMRGSRTARGSTSAAITRTWRPMSMPRSRILLFEHGSLDRDGASAYLSALQCDRRYRIDVY
jgi:hypothetical protein